MHDQQGQNNRFVLLIIKKIWGFKYPITIAFLWTKYKPHSCILRFLQAVQNILKYTVHSEH